MWYLALLVLVSLAHGLPRLVPVPVTGMHEADRVKIPVDYNLVPSLTYELAPAPEPTHPYLRALRKDDSFYESYRSLMDDMPYRSADLYRLKYRSEAERRSLMETLLNSLQSAWGEFQHRQQQFVSLFIGDSSINPGWQNFVDSLSSVPELAWMSNPSTSGGSFFAATSHDGHVTGAGGSYVNNKPKVEYTLDNTGVHHPKPLRLVPEINIVPSEVNPPFPRPLPPVGWPPKPLRDIPSPSLSLRGIPLEDVNIIPPSAIRPPPQLLSLTKPEASMPLKPIPAPLPPPVPLPSEHAHPPTPIIPPLSSPSTVTPLDPVPPTKPELPLIPGPPLTTRLPTMESMPSSLPKPPTKEPMPIYNPPVILDPKPSPLFKPSKDFNPEPLLLSKPSMETPKPSILSKPSIEPLPLSKPTSLLKPPTMLDPKPSIISNLPSIPDPSTVSNLPSMPKPLETPKKPDASSPMAEKPKPPMPEHPTAPMPSPIPKPPTL